MLCNVYRKYLNTVIYSCLVELYGIIYVCRETIIDWLQISKFKTILIFYAVPTKYYWIYKSQRNNHLRVEIWKKTEESKTTSDLSDLGDWIKSLWVPIVGMYFELSMECHMNYVYTPFNIGESQCILISADTWTSKTTVILS